MMMMILLIVTLLVLGSLDPRISRVNAFSVERRPRLVGIHRSAADFHSSTLLYSLSKDLDTPKQRSKRRRRNYKNKQKRGSSNQAQTWRIFGVNVSPDALASDYSNQDDKTIPVEKRYLTPPVLKALYKRLKLPEKDDSTGDVLPPQLSDVRVVRKSLDARQKRRGAGQDGPRYTFVIDVTVRAGSSIRALKHQPGRCELLHQEQVKKDTALLEKEQDDSSAKPKVLIVGAGPAGLFCALTLARSGLVTPVLLERGQPVESRGKDIGALMHRRSLDEESNFAFGEGGAGTWSDGKLTTRIGRNSDAVRFVLETLVEYGAPESILVDGSPHLGTDNLVRLLRNMRLDLRQLGGEIVFGAKVTGLLMDKNGVTKGVNVTFSEAIERGTGEVAVASQHEGDETILGDAVVLATGHSARDVYEKLHHDGVKLEAKGFAAGFRVEHPQKLINEIQYGREWGPAVVTGKKVTDTVNQEYFASDKQSERHSGRLPVPSYRLATNNAFDGEKSRGAYSFCMCPGGQIVLASTNPDEVCVNGMSFSKRDSQWANSALVVTVPPDDNVLDPYRKEHGVLAGLAFQKDMERKAAIMGGGDLTVPVQRLTDFVNGVASTTAPPSSYRLGVKPAACHEIYPEPIVTALRDALVNYFEKTMPGYLSEDGLLHAVETRTSSPVRVSRDADTLQAVGTKRLFPAGEGAGFAGGIVSAAVDGMVVAEAVMDTLLDSDSSSKNGSSWKAKTKSVGFSY